MAFPAVRQSSIRKGIYYAAKSLTGSRAPQIYEARLLEFKNRVDDADLRLSALLRHCAANVPYYRRFMAGLNPRDVDSDPRHCLVEMPVLSRELLSTSFEELKSLDLPKRKWKVNRSGGSTGQPVEFIQDAAYLASTSANSLLCCTLCGKQPGDGEVRLWGSERDIFQHGVGWKAALQSRITNTRVLNAFNMSRDSMRAYLGTLNTVRPRLIVAYAQALYELAQFAEEQSIAVVPQNAAMTSAGSLFPFMRDTIERVLGCRVYNRYGSREVGDIACELPEIQGLGVGGSGVGDAMGLQAAGKYHGMSAGDGLWVAPWGSYIEIVDDAGLPVADGIDGNILVTSLANFAMPLVRYRIGDVGALAPAMPNGPVGQRLLRVTGRSTDNFRTREGRVVPGEYFIHLIGVVLNKGSIRKFQVIQQEFDRVAVRIVTRDGAFDTNEISEKVRLVMGADCAIETVFVDEIPNSASGKFRNTICELEA